MTNDNAPKFRVTVVRDETSYCWDGEEWQATTQKDETPEETSVHKPEPHKHKVKHATKHK